MELADLEAVLQDRLATAPPESYSASLFRDPERAQRKIMEEAFELCLELGRHARAGGDSRRTAEEAADLIFHVLVGLVGARVSLDEVLTVLRERRK